MTLALDHLHQGDCIDLLAKLKPGSVNLVFADPPFNIGYEYDVYHDRKADDEYLAWSKKWISGVHKALAPDGTFWLAIGDEYAAELKCLATREVGFYCRSWVIWYYTFGVNCTKKFNRSHVHLFHFVKDPSDFTFNADDPSVRVPSARQLVYADGRANPRGRLPDDTWILRPQDLPEGFQPTDDTWYFPRVAGTFKERAGFHGCQMPERLLARIILASSRPDDCVLDPFSGSGSTLAVAKKLGRRWMGFELSKEYVRLVRSRIDSIFVGDALDGMADPITSAPSTASRAARAKQGIRGELQLVAKRAVIRSDRAQSKSVQNKDFAPIRSGAATRTTNATVNRIYHPTTEERQAIVRAFLASHEGFATDPVLADPRLNSSFCDACKREGLPGLPRDWNRWLLNLRKVKALPRETQRKVALRSSQLDGFIFASEIASQSVMSESFCTLDEMLCDPDLVKRFDDFARRLAPGYEAFHYRWGALRLRKRGSAKRKKMQSLGREDVEHVFRSKRSIEASVSTFKKEDRAGLYMLSDGVGKELLYVGETLSFCNRLSAHFASKAVAFNGCRVSCIAIDDWQSRDTENREAIHAYMVDRHRPRFNLVSVVNAQAKQV